MLSYPNLEAEWVALFAAVVLASIAVWLSWRRGPRRTAFAQERPRARIIMAVTLALTFIAAEEAALRLHHVLRPVSGTVPNAKYHWAMEPNLRDYRHQYEVLIGDDPRDTVNVRGYWCETIVSTNDLGLREIEVTPEKKPGELRLLCLGDSWTFGQGVAQNETYAKRLQALLRQRYPDRVVSVVNAGQQGFNAFQGYKLLCELLPVYHPDIVLFGGFNSIGNLQVLDMQMAAERISLPVEGVRDWVRQSRLYMVLRRQAERLVSRPEANALDDPKVPEAELRFLRAMAVRAREAGARSVFFDSAFHVRRREMAYAPVLRELYQRLVEGGDGVAVELHPVSSDAQRSAYMQNPDTTHPSARGHQVMAESLLTLLIDKGLLPSPSASPDPALKK